MPTYEFHCKDCNKTFSIQLTIAEFEKKSPPKCPHCKGSNVRQIFSSVSVQTDKKS
ncbi:MAG: zinc ribbon domain-containing protein [Aliifodinibius sp.]|nr:zinc ribbon domain-containing protein [candidate division Zixibacteria bacterium]NIT61219.1 zinc ribbon domain-containing protein [Fodinibius sp.]NIS48638.1 zinc ribbon domain-containing protein [candidate division Zixibacteria bacterium]NIU16705.1 zinc ribbon domain-containing protein [candidate division Zixibacteria bacterium]NIV08873.1 zinc ribbon domain-containing protein [candidate division Zixibacteria bacterium]